MHAVFSGVVGMEDDDRMTARGGPAHHEGARPMTDTPTQGDNVGDLQGDLQSSSIRWGCQVRAALEDLNTQMRLMEDAIGLLPDPSMGLVDRLQRLGVVHDEVTPQEHAGAEIAQMAENVYKAWAIGVCERTPANADVQPTWDDVDRLVRAITEYAIEWPPTTRATQRSTPFEQAPSPLQRSPMAQAQ
jgi:hypothetical protein